MCRSYKIKRNEFRLANKGEKERNEDEKHSYPSISGANGRRKKKTSHKIGR